MDIELNFNIVNLDSKYYYQSSLKDDNIKYQEFDKDISNIEKINKKFNYIIRHNNTIIYILSNKKINSIKINNLEPNISDDNLVNDSKTITDVLDKEKFNQYYINPKNIYGLTKKINEEISSLSAVNNKISIVGLRFFTVFGEWGRPDMLIFKYLKSSFNRKEKFYLNNYGHHTRDFTYINDVNKILYNLLNKKHPIQHCVFNICSNNPIKITKILDLINKITKKNPKIIKRSFQNKKVKS